MSRYASSRRRFTICGVTNVARFRVGRTGTPCRFLVPWSRGASALRTRSEITRPAVVPRRAASSLAVSSTSLSMSRVVRINHIIAHQTSDVKSLPGGRDGEVLVAAKDAWEASGYRPPFDDARESVSLDV
jgi:hypothetical protein